MMKPAFVTATILGLAFLAADPPPADAQAAAAITPDGPDDPTLELVEKADRHVDRISTLEQRIEQLQSRLDRQQARLAETNNLIDESAPTDLDLWVDGFLDAGGPAGLVDLFIRPGGIIQAESAFVTDVVGPTHDYGLAQINRAAHHDRVEAIFGTGTFETLMRQPYENGFVAGLLAAESGTGPWFMSEHNWS